MRVSDLVAAPPPEIIDPPQYSIAWLILAALCLLVAGALIWGTLRVTAAVERRRAVRRRPTEVDALKAEFLRAVNDVADRHAAGGLDAREGHRELTGVMRRFVRRTTGHDVTTQDVATLRADPRTREVGDLVAAFLEPEFAASSSARLDTSVRSAREVIRRWS